MCLCCGSVYCAAEVKHLERASAVSFRWIVSDVAMRFGSAAGILGTLAVALIFAAFLFHPMPTHLDDKSLHHSLTRENL